MVFFESDRIFTPTKSYYKSTVLKIGVQKIFYCLARENLDVKGRVCSESAPTFSLCGNFQKCEIGN